MTGSCIHVGADHYAVIDETTRYSVKIFYGSIGMHMGHDFSRIYLVESSVVLYPTVYRHVNLRRWFRSTKGLRLRSHRRSV